MSAPHDYYEYLDADLADERAARRRKRVAAGLAAGIAAAAAAALLGACQSGQPTAWPTAIRELPADPASTTTPSTTTPTTTTPPTTTPTTTTPPTPAPDPAVPDDVPEDPPDDDGETDGMEPDPEEDEPTEPDPCDALEDGVALLVTPDPVELDDGVMSAALTITNCSDEHVDWTASTLPTVTLADDGGNLGPDSSSELAFDIDAAAYEPGAIEFTIWISEPSTEHYIDVHAFHEEVLM